MNDIEGRTSRVVWMVDGVNICEDLISDGDVEVLLNVGASNLEVPALAHLPCLEHDETEHVVKAPRVRLLETHDAELDGRLIVLAVEISIHAVYIGLQARQESRTDLLGSSGAHLAKGVHAKQHVGFDGHLADNLSDAPMDQKSMEVHLEHAIVRSHIALREIEVAHILRVDMRNTKVVVGNVDGGLEALD